MSLSLSNLRKLRYKVNICRSQEERDAGGGKTARGEKGRGERGGEEGRGQKGREFEKLSETEEEEGKKGG